MSSAPTLIKIRRTRTAEGYYWKVENWHDYVKHLKQAGIIGPDDSPIPYTVFISDETASDSENYMDIDKQIPILFQLKLGTWEILL
jgi:hypothetical protein